MSMAKWELLKELQNSQFLFNNNVNVRLHQSAMLFILFNSSCVAKI